MRKYSLSRHPAGHYPKYFRPDALVFVPSWLDDRRGPPREQPEQYKCRVGEDELAFHVYIESHKGAVVPDLVEVSREVLAHIVELDSFASEIDPSDEYQGQLVYVEITRKEIHLRYHSTTVNAEWGMYFKRVGPGEFEFLVCG